MYLYVYLYVYVFVCVYKYVYTYEASDDPAGFAKTLYFNVCQMCCSSTPVPSAETLHFAKCTMALILFFECVADVLLINTCAIRENAENKIWEARRILKSQQPSAFAKYSLCSVLYRMCSL